MTIPNTKLVINYHIDVCKLHFSGKRFLGNYILSIYNERQFAQIDAYILTRTFIYSQLNTCVSVYVHRYLCMQQWIYNLPFLERQDTD